MHDREKRQNLKNEILMAYGGVCFCCGESNVKFLTIDHINNDGAAHRKAVTGNSRGTRGFQYWLKRNGFPEGFQVLCFNCNCGKQVNGGICPHKDQRKAI